MGVGCSAVSEELQPLRLSRQRVRGALLSPILVFSSI